MRESVHLCGLIFQFFNVSKKATETDPMAFRLFFNLISNLEIFPEIPDIGEYVCWTSEFGIHQ